MIANVDNAFAVWPVCRTKKYGLNLLRNPLLTPYLGPLFFYDDSVKPHKKITIQEKLFEQLWQQLPTWSFFDMQCIPEYNNFLPFQHKGFSHTQRLTYEIHLSQDEENIFAAINATRRNNIRQAERELHIIEGITDLETFYAMYQNTLQRKGKNYSVTKHYFTNIVFAAIEHHAGQMFTAKDTLGKIHAIIFVVFDHQRMYYLLSAINPQQAHNGAVAMLLWNAIKTAKEKKLNIFDFEGSVDKGVELFFRSFGGQRQSFLSCSNTASPLWRWKQILIG